MSKYRKNYINKKARRFDMDKAFANIVPLILSIEGILIILILISLFLPLSQRIIVETQIENPNNINSRITKISTIPLLPYVVSEDVWGNSDDEVGIGYNYTIRLIKDGKEVKNYTLENLNRKKTIYILKYKAFKSSKENEDKIIVEIPYYKYTEELEIGKGTINN